MKRPTALLAAFALFLAGILAGVLGTHLFYLKRLQQPGLIIDSIVALALRDLDHHFDLTPEQHEKVSAILDKAAQRSLVFRREVILPGIVDIVAEVRKEVEPILTPEQRAKMGTLRERYGGRLEKMIAEESAGQ